ncbi:helix-turn-helix domain-containing protein [Luteimonas fraxinea]|uniref:helix-turn-helix domain-containing protein n=1 Tax=Luteimonas fraxinea TaxID=2901869 RepID=UPI001E4083C2|nr:helix-turn-helix transcriptional regulator [Luteimonas fraxinea]MCD9125868.1 helix-turn-helix domain-containing protein [Luteimonas fraxinea]
MDAQRKLIGLAKERGGFATYSAMAERMGVTTATMSQWRSGSVPLSENRLEELCDFAGENAGFWDISIRAERAKSSSLRRQLEAFLKAGAVLTVGLLAWQPALGSAPSFPTNGQSAFTLCEVLYSPWSAPSTLQTASELPFCRIPGS